MSDLAPLLPEGFEELGQFRDWILASELERNVRRLGSSMDELQRFYDAMHRHLERIAGLLARRKLTELSAPEKNLMLLTLSLMEVSACIELFAAVRVPFAVPAERLRILQ